MRVEWDVVGGVWCHGEAVWVVQELVLILGQKKKEEGALEGLEREGGCMLGCIHSTSRKSLLCFP